MIGEINHIIVIESLENERLTGTELFNDCILRQIEFRKSDIKPKFHSVADQNQFREILKYYMINAKYMNGGILMHLETHGNDNLSGLVFADGSTITWKDLVGLFRPINIATSNKLYITLATCNGRFLYRGAEDTEKSPYSCYISASEEVSAAQIFEQYSLLFERLIEFGNVVDAYLYMEQHGTSFFYKDSESTFEEAFKVTAHQMRTNPIYKDEFYQTLARAAGIPFEEMIENVLKDTYKEHKRTFDFKDCD